MRTIANEIGTGISNYISDGIHENSMGFKVPKAAKLQGMHKPYKCDFIENKKKLEELENA